MSVQCVAIFWVINASSCEKSSLQFSIPTWSGLGGGGGGGVLHIALKFRTYRNSEIPIPDVHKIPKSHSSELLIHENAICPTLWKPEVFVHRIAITPTYHSPESLKSRMFYSSEFLLLRCPSYTDVNVLLTNEQQKANEHWNFGCLSLRVNAYKIYLYIYIRGVSEK